MQEDLSRAQWRKSSYSGNTGNCLAVAQVSNLVVLRDSHDPNGPILAFSNDDWRAFVQQLKTGRSLLRLIFSFVPG